MIVKLKPCPKCGLGEGDKYDSNAPMCLGFGGFVVECERCGYTPKKEHNTPRAACEAWNKLKRRLAHD